MPRTLERLEKKLAERAHAWMKEVNKAFKKGDAALLALGMTQAQIDKMRQPCRAVTINRTHNFLWRTTVRRYGAASRHGLKSSRLRLERDHQDALAGGTVVDNVEENGCKSCSTISRRRHADQAQESRLSLEPRNGAWQRMRSNAATYYAKQICGICDALKPTA